MPSKALIHLANVRHASANAPAGLGGALPIDGRAVMNHVRTLRDDFTEAVIAGMASWRDEHFLPRRARFLDPHTLDLQSGTRLTAGHCIVATGSRPVLPAAWSAWSGHLLDTDSFFELPELPASVIVIGLGPVGIELSQALARLGVEVRGIDPGPGIGGLTDPELVECARQVLSQDFPLLQKTADVTRADVHSVAVRAGEQDLQAERALVSMGRRPAVEGLGLENLGRPLNDDGLPDVDAETLQVSDLPVFIAGDVNGIRPLLHEASDEGRIAGYNVLQERPAHFARRSALQITFTTPSMAVVGQSHAELEAGGSPFVSGRASYAAQGRARIMDANEGIVKVYADRSDGRLLGAELFAPGAEHLAHLLAWAQGAGLTVPDMLALPYYHPVLEEGLRGAIRDAANQIATPTSYTDVMRCADNAVQ
jgi:dihydrolipoamide dehydrogenase